MTNRVEIVDFDYETMQELLRFIYCGKVLNLGEVALDLLPAADKVFKSLGSWGSEIFFFKFQYNLLKLKDICAKFLEDHLNVGNVLEILEVANIHQCKELKERAIAYMGWWVILDTCYLIHSISIFIKIFSFKFSVIFWRSWCLLIGWNSLLLSPFLSVESSANGSINFSRIWSILCIQYMFFNCQ